jgi:CubicO group peptidase (beta-lactamase class C family)
MKKLIVFSLTYLSFISTLFGQAPNTSPLFLELEKQDSLLFERGFNNCDIQYLEKVVDSNLIFYHDKTGIQNKKVFINSIKKYICTGSTNKPFRKVDKESLEVFPLYRNDTLYGAIQNGVHGFYIRTTEKGEVLAGKARFTHVYLLENGNWLLKEALSYDHIPASSINIYNDSDKEIEELLLQNRIPAMGLGIIKNGALSQVKVYGNLKKNAPAPYNTIFKIASLTKPVVALLTLKLISNGQLNLDEPLYTYWIDPDLIGDQRYKKITPRIILSHQTGFPNWRTDTKTKKLQFDFEPGTKYQYSGEGFIYLQKALEKKFKKNIDELAASILFYPLKMNDTHFWWDNSLDTKRFAEGHDAQGNQYNTYKYYKANAAGSILTTIADYGKFMTYILKHGGLSDTVYNEMTKPQVKIKENDFFGLGWELLTNFSSGDFALVHTGKIDGASSLAILFPKTQNGYVILLNGENANNIYQKLLTEYLYLGKEIWERK